MRQRDPGSPLPFAAQCYLLMGRDVVPCSAEELAAWREANPDAGVVADDVLTDAYGIRTEFAGKNLRPRSSRPLTFQTSVLHRGVVVEQRLSSSWDEALSTHQSAWTDWKGLLR